MAKATLFKSPLHINTARVLVMEHLMGRQQFFLELFYRYASVNLLAVLVFSFGKLWKIAFAGGSLLFYLGIS